MRTLTVTIDDTDYNRLGIKKDVIPFSELKDKINAYFAEAALKKCHRVAEKTGLSMMTMEEINAEIQAAGDNAKGCH